MALRDWLVVLGVTRTSLMRSGSPAVGTRAGEFHGAEAGARADPPPAEAGPRALQEANRQHQLPVGGILRHIDFLDQESTAPSDAIGEHLNSAQTVALETGALRPPSRPREPQAAPPPAKAGANPQPTEPPRDP